MDDKQWYDEMIKNRSTDYAMTGKVIDVKNTGNARRTVWLDNGHTFRIIGSQIAHAIDNAEYRNEKHTFILTASGIYKTHVKNCD